MEKPVIRKPWHRERCPTVINGPSLTVQSEAASCDLNRIMAKHKAGQPAIIRSQGAGEYRDLSNVTTKHDAMNMITDAQRQYEDLPAEIRQAYPTLSDFAAVFEDQAEAEAFVKEFLSEAQEEDPPGSSVDPGPGPDKPERARQEAPPAPQEPSTGSGGTVAT